jgi:hypothetical protein
VTTVKRAVAEASAELAQEQAYVTMLYERLDAMRAATARRLAEVLDESFGRRIGGRL